MIKEEYIDGSYAGKNPSFHIEDASWKAKQILSAISKANVKASSIAEVGCGSGEILVQLSKHLPATKLCGYELSPYAYSLCQERETEQITYFNRSPMDENQKFDLMLCIDVIEHVEDYFTFLRTLRNCAEWFIFHVPLDMNVQMVARSTPIAYVRKKVGHIHYFSMNSALATLQECGYSVEDCFLTSVGTSRPKSIKSKILYIPRKILYRISPELTSRYLGGYSLLIIAKSTK